MKRTILSLTALSLFGGTALADDHEVEGEETGYRDVVLTDGGPTDMEDKRDYSQIITVGLAILPATTKATYRYAMSDDLSVMVGGGFGSADWQLGSDDGAKLQRVIGTVGLDYHPIGNGMHGFFIGPRATYTVWSITSNGDEAYSSQRFDVRGLIGYRWIFDPGLSVSVGVGTKYTNIVREAGDSGELSFGREGVGAATELQLGWAF